MGRGTGRKAGLNTRGGSEGKYVQCEALVSHQLETKTKEEESGSVRGEERGEGEKEAKSVEEELLGVGRKWSTLYPRKNAYVGIQLANRRSVVSPLPPLRTRPPLSDAAAGDPAWRARPNTCWRRSGVSVKGRAITEEGPSPPLPHTWRSSPVATAHSRTASSQEPEASIVPSGEKTTIVTRPVWPSSTWGAAGPGGRWVLVGGRIGGRGGKRG